MGFYSGFGAWCRGIDIDEAGKGGSRELFVRYLREESIYRISKKNIYRERKISETACDGGE